MVRWEVLVVHQEVVEPVDEVVEGGEAATLGEKAVFQVREAWGGGAGLLYLLGSWSFQDRVCKSRRMI